MSIYCQVSTVILKYTFYKKQNSFNIKLLVFCVKVFHVIKQMKNNYLISIFYFVHHNHSITKTKTTIANHTENKLILIS